MKKFKLTKETMEMYGITFHRVEAVADFGSVKAGDKGGWVEKEENLNQEGDAWVYGNARVYGNAEVYGDAVVSGDAWVSGNAEVYGDAEVYGKLKLEAGLYFGFLFKNEKVQKIKNHDGTTLLWKK
ncbi:MAG: hypothetical protein KGJ13_12330 [Patescibacteria group bacterium]|nr:hypothetical protein [Patescibacteria group bacterium]